MPAMSATSRSNLSTETLNAFSRTEQTVIAGKPHANDKQG
jgi:hypothetical protein